MKTLHYIYDPLCGWCYAASALLDVTQTIDGLCLRLHAGGLFPQPSRLSAEMRRHIRISDERIAALSGQPFGEAYLDGLLIEPDTIYDSMLPIAAIISAETLQAGSGLAMLKAIQHAHYRHGQRVAEPQVLAQLAADLGLQATAFAQRFAHTAGDTVRSHVASTRKLMETVQARGFPAFVLERDSTFVRVPHEDFYGNPHGFAQALQEQI